MYLFKLFLLNILNNLDNNIYRKYKLKLNILENLLFFKRIFSKNFNYQSILISDI